MALFFIVVVYVSFLSCVRSMVLLLFLLLVFSLFLVSLFSRVF